MLITSIDPADIQTAASMIPPGTPIVMLNLVRYKHLADYGGTGSLPPCSGREAYLTRYAPAFNTIAQRSEHTRKIRPVFLSSAVARLVGPADELWHDIVLVEYPDFAAFRTVVESPDYERDAAPHRRAALENWRLIATLKQNLG